MKTEVSRVNDNYAIELKHITKRFGQVVANDKVCLSLKKERFSPFWVRTEAGRPLS